MNKKTVSEIAIRCCKSRVLGADDCPAACPHCAQLRVCLAPSMSGGSPSGKGGSRSHSKEPEHAFWCFNLKIIKVAKLCQAEAGQKIQKLERSQERIEKDHQPQSGHGHTAHTGEAICCPQEHPVGLLQLAIDGQEAHHK